MINLDSYDVVLVNSSGGKDSQAMLDFVATHDTLVNPAKVVVVHCDLGRAEWAGTRELAQRQAEEYGFRFEVVSREQDLLDQVEQRGKWPSSTARYCTSDHKRAQVYKLLTKLTTEVRAANGGRRARILNCLGLRAEESPARSAKPALAFDKMASNGRRDVTTWLPIHDWSEAQVWERIRASGIPHHRAYDLGMKRLSCCFCIFAPKSALLLAGKHNPDLLGQYVAVERKIGHTFRKGFTLLSVQQDLAAGVAVDTSADNGCWGM